MPIQRRFLQLHLDFELHLRFNCSINRPRVCSIERRVARTSVGCLHHGTVCRTLTSSFGSSSQKSRLAVIMFACCCEPLGPGFGSENSFPGDRRFTKTGGNALAAAPQQGAPQSSAPQYGATQSSVPQYGAPQAPPSSSSEEKVVAGTSNLL
jgi:hypothetical protein